MSKFKNFLISAVLSAAIFGGMMYFVLSVFTVKVSFAIPATVGATVLLCTCASPLLGKREWVVPTLWSALTLLFAAFFRERTADGLAQLLNEIIDTYRRVHPRNYEMFAVGDGAGLPYAVAELSVLLALGCAEAVKHRSVLLGWGAVTLLAAATAVFLPVMTAAQTVVAALTVLTLWLIGFAYRKQKVDFAVRRSVLRAWLRTATVFLLLLAILCTAIGTENRPSGVDSLAESTVELIDTLRYGSTEGTGLLEGDLSEAGTRQIGTETMLRVTMSQPTSYYLRGFIGEVYGNNRWTELSREVLYESCDAFYTLHQSGFYAQSQLAAAADVSEMLQTQNAVQIENIGLPSKYLYAPYELLPWSTVLDRDAVGDSTVYADGFRGTREYSLTAAGNLVTEYQKIAALLYQRREEGATAEYLKNEAAYNRFAYAQYTALPSDIDSYLSEKLGDFLIDEGQIHFDYQKAKQNILYYLTESMTYDEAVGAVEDGVDFVLNFLDGTKSGYDVHYATAAVMMFRYYGIPARYAEGYIITKDEAANAAPGETLSLDSSHAHAWAEYYQDGLGWLPFEVTPTYLSVMEQADTYTDISGLVGQAPENEVIDVMQPDTITEEETPLLLSFWLKNRLTVLLVLVLLVLTLLLVLFLAWLIRERRKTAKRKAGFLSGDLHRAICDIFGYIIDVSVANGLKPDNRPAEGYADFFDAELREDYRAVVTVWQEAKFSKNEMREEQRARAIALKDELWRRTWENAGLFRKLQLKFMYFL